MTFYLARHGETEWNRAGRMQGRHGGQLTDKGLTQARLLGETARRLGVVEVLSSSLSRAVDTARIVAEIAGAELRVTDALVETEFGACSGLTEAEIDARYPGLREERSRDKWHHRWPDGESYADTAERVLGGPSFRRGMLVIAHQSINRAIAHLWGPLPVAEALSMTQPSDVLLRIDGSGRIAHARVDGGPAEFVDGLFSDGRPRLN